MRLGEVVCRQQAGAFFFFCCAPLCTELQSIVHIEASAKKVGQRLKTCNGVALSNTQVPASQPPHSHHPFPLVPRFDIVENRTLHKCSTSASKKCIEKQHIKSCRKVQARVANLGLNLGLYFKIFRIFFNNKGTFEKVPDLGVSQVGENGEKEPALWVT